MLVFMSLRTSLQAMKHTRPSVITILAGNVLNLLLNWVFVFGHFGFPAMGAVGSALSSACGRVFMLGLLLVIAWSDLRPMLRPWRRAALARGPLLQTLRIGSPIRRV